MANAVAGRLRGKKDVDSKTVEDETKETEVHPGTSLTGLYRYFPPTVIRDEEKRDSQWDSIDQKDTTDSKGISSESEMSEGQRTEDCHNPLDDSQHEDGDVSAESQIGVSDCAVVADTAERQRRPKRKVAYQVSYEEDVSSSENSSEDDVITTGQGLQHNITITRFFSRNPDPKMTKSGRELTAEDEVRCDDQSDTEPGVKCVEPMIVSSDYSEMEGDSEESPSVLQEYKHVSKSSSEEVLTGRLSPGLNSQQIADNTLPTLICDESARSNCKEVFSQPTNFRITKFFSPTVKSKSESVSPQSDEEDNKTAENRDEENENEGTEDESENERTEWNEDEEDDENEDESMKEEEERIVTHTSASTANVRTRKSSTSGEERDEDEEEETNNASTSKQPASHSVLKFLTPVVTPVQVPSPTLDSDDYDKSDASDKENWASITEVSTSSSKQQKQTLLSHKMSMPDVLSKIRQVQSKVAREVRKKSSTDHLQWSLEVNVIVDNSRGDFLDCSSTEESTDEDYTRIMQEEDSVLRLCGPVMGCELDPGDNELDSETGGQLSGPELLPCKKTRKRRHPQSMADSGNDVDDMGFDVLKRSVRQRTVVSDSELSGESDSGLGISIENHLQKMAEEEGTGSRDLLCSEGDDELKKDTTARQRRMKKMKRRQLVSKEEMQSLVENQSVGETAGSRIQKMGKNGRDSGLGLVYKEGKEKSKRRTSSHQQRPVKIKGLRLNGKLKKEDAVKSESTDDHLQEIGKEDRPIEDCPDKEEEKKCKTGGQQERRKKKRHWLISKQELADIKESQGVSDELDPACGSTEISRISVERRKRRSARLAAMQNQPVVIPDDLNEDRQDVKNNGFTVTRKATKPDKTEQTETERTKSSTQEVPKQLFPLFYKPSKDRNDLVDINLITDCREPEIPLSFPQPKAKKMNSQPPAISYIPFPDTSHVLQYNKGTPFDQQPDSKGFVIRESPALLTTDVQSHCTEPLYLGLFTSCQCKAELPVVAHVVPIGEEERQQLVSDISHGTPSIDVHALYKKFLQEADNGNLNVWTEVFAPSSNDELAVDRSAVVKLYKWLADWEKSPETIKTRKETPIKRSVALDDKRDLDWLEEDDDFVVIRQCRKRQRQLESESEEEDMEACNAVLLLGRHGSGKTAAVYACAKDLGLTVIELNASTRRSGRTIQASLTEATQSRHVSSIDTTNPKPGGTKVTAHNSGTEQKDRKPNKPFFHPAFASFRTNSNSVDKTSYEDKKELRRASRRQKAVRDMINSDSETDEKACSSGTDAGEPQITETAQKDGAEHAGGCGQLVNGAGPTVVLLDEVDVVFETDSGFWSAVSSIVGTAKRPVIMTAVDESVLEKIDFPCEVVRFELSEEVQARLVTLLQLICLAEGVHVDPDTLKFLSEHYRTDVRRCINTLQFWCSTVKTNTSIPCSTTWPMHLDCLKSIRVKPSSEPGSLIEGIASCDPQFWASCESFKLLSELNCPIDLLLPFLFSESNKERNNSSIKAVCYAELHTLARWCESLSDRDMFQYQRRLTHSNADCQCCEQPSLIDSLPVATTEVDELLGKELASSLNAASLNYSHVQFARGVSSIYEERTEHKNDGIVLDVSHLVSKQKNLEQCMASRLSLLDQVMNALPTHLHCSKEVISTDYLPAIRAVCSTEKFNERMHTKRRRFRHYFHYWMDSDLCQSLTQDFTTRPQMT